MGLIVRGQLRPGAGSLTGDSVARDALTAVRRSSVSDLALSHRTRTISTGP